MKTEKWLELNTASLAGKTVVITGSTGGIGTKLCEILASLGASLVLADRNTEKSEENGKRLQSRFPSLSVSYVRCDLEDIPSVKRAAKELCAMPVDVLIHNAGAYSIPRHKCATGLDNVFQINFASPYYLTKMLLPVLRERGGRVVAVGSIAHNYSETDPADVDFSSRTRASRVYGNAKRYLMFSLYGLFENESNVSLAVCHPGITFTNITAHYPKAVLAIIKNPMKVIFMKPERACLSIVRGVFEDCKSCEWIGPRFFDVWGLPAKRTLDTCPPEERARIFGTAEQIYADIENCKIPTA